MQKITPCLWSNGRAQEMAEFYTSIFTNSRIKQTLYYPEGAPAPFPAGSVLTITFDIAGQEFTILNGGPEFQFDEAISLVVNCKDQAEVDEVWAKLTADGGEESQCGWLKDKFGVSWQVVPVEFDRMFSKATPEKATRMMEAMMPMKKLDLAVFEAIFNE